MEETCPICGEESWCDMPNGYALVYICEECGIYWDETGEVAHNK